MRISSKPLNILLVVERFFQEACPTGEGVQARNEHGEEGVSQCFPDVDPNTLSETIASTKRVHTACRSSTNVIVISLAPLELELVDGPLHPFT